MRRKTRNLLGWNLNDSMLTCSVNYKISFDIFFLNSFLATLLLIFVKLSKLPLLLLPLLLSLSCLLAAQSYAAGGGVFSFDAAAAAAAAYLFLSAIVSFPLDELNAVNLVPTVNGEELSR